MFSLWLSYFLDRKRLKFAAEAQEEAARRVLEAQDVAVGDLLPLGTLLGKASGLRKSMDRHRFQTKVLA